MKKTLNELPVDYRNFINSSEVDRCFMYPRKNADIKHTLRSWQLYGTTGLIDQISKKNKGLSHHVEVHLELREEEMIVSSLGFIHPRRVSNGFVIGHSRGDYLYLDGEDNDSVWIFYCSSGGVQRLANSFSDWLMSAQLETEFTAEMMIPLQHKSKRTKKAKKLVFTRLAQ